MIKETGIYKEASEALLHSYSQILFARSRAFGLCLLLVSFIRPAVGVHGLMAVIATALMVPLFKLDRKSLRDGIWTFCSAMCGMYIGYLFEFNYISVLLTLLASLISLMFTVMLHGWLGKLRLPVLTLPFIFTSWVIYTFSLHIHPIIYNPSYIYPNISGNPQWLNSLDEQVRLYIHNPYTATLFKTFSGIFFAHSDAAGILIIIGLFLYSRISFVCAIVGFTVAFGVYQLFGLPVHQLTFGLSGANYILMMIAIGGFFLIPNRSSFLISILMSVVLTGFIFFFNHILFNWALSAFTLAFSVTSIMFLYFIKWQSQYKNLIPVLYQYNQPEKNLYQYLNGKERFDITHSKLSLPVIGEWFVSQGYDGKQTHLGKWKYALDFVIRDEEGSTWANHGTQRSDYYCYNKPVVAPADGTIVGIVNNVEDNEIGEVDMAYNWGNSIIIQHGENVYTQLSHLKKDSIMVVLGQFVTRGQTLASVGNSGRSPEPHLHFQVQRSPVLGAETISYPFAYYIDDNGLQQQKTPQAFEEVRMLEPAALLQQAFKLNPGTKLKIKYKEEIHHWECFTDAYNRSYIYSHSDDSYMYYEYDGMMFRANSFQGDEDGPLYIFFGALYDVCMELQPDLTLKNHLPVNFGANIFARFLQDLVAPFYIYNRKSYNIKCVSADNKHFPSSVVFQSYIGKGSQQLTYEIEVAQKQLKRITNLHQPENSLWFEN